MDQVRRRVEGLIRDGAFLPAFETLLADGIPPEDAPSLWEQLGTSARQAGAESLAHQVFMLLWDADIRSTVVGIELARDRLTNGRYRDAAYFLTETFGAAPEDPEARQLLAEVQAELAPDEAIRLIGETWKTNARSALIRIDALRSLDELSVARETVEAARGYFPNDTRFVVRGARIQEALGNWAQAIDAWTHLSQSGLEPGTAPDAQIVRLQMRLERRQDALTRVGHLLASDLSILERLRLADLFDQTPMLRAALEMHAEHGMSQADSRVVGKWLREHGYLGALIWMSVRGIRPSSSLQDAALSVLKPPQIRQIQTGTLTEALKVRSPECLLPVSQRALRMFRRTAFRAANGDRSAYLLVNATLSAGGAERQFMMLVQALRRNLIPPDQIHLAILSLVRDRGHAHFLSSLEHEGAIIHDLRGEPRMKPDEASELAPFLTLMPDPLQRDVLSLLPLAMRLNAGVLHGWQDRSALACGVVGMILGTPRVIMSSRNMRPELRGDRATYGATLYRHFLQSRPGFLLTANSKAGAQDYADWVGVPKGSIPLIGNAIDVEAYPVLSGQGDDSNAARSSERVLTIGGVFRLAANKRPELWLRTLAELKARSSRPLRVRLVGRGPFEAQVRQLAGELGLEDMVTQAGLDDAREIYAGMDVLLLMSRVEGTPNVLLEAQACGLPVAACDVGGVCDAVCQDDPGKGLVLPKNVSPQEAAEAILEWLPTITHPEGPNARRAFVARMHGPDTLKTAVRHAYGLPLH